jgi:hypothetical protein
MSYKFIKLNFPIDIRDNFWDNNFQISLIDPFKKLYDRDTTNDKSLSSKEMYCIWLLEDPSYENKIYRLEDKMKRSAILSYYPEFDFHDEIIIECRLHYDEFCLTPAAKSFKIEEISLAKRAKFIDNAVYTLPEPLLDDKGRPVYVGGRPAMLPGTAKEIDGMRKLTLDLYKKYEMVKRMFEEEQKSNPVIWGGGVETMLDEGNLIDVNDDE